MFAMKMKLNLVFVIISVNWLMGQLDLEQLAGYTSKGHCK